MGLLSMARPQTVTDDEILQATLDCILERGSSVSLDVIAGKLGVSAQALLKRFHSKKELVFAALRPPEDCPWHQLVLAGPTEAPVEEQLHDIAREMSLFFVDIVRRFAVLRFSGLDPRTMLQSYSEPPPLVDIRVLCEWFDRAAERGFVRSGDHRTTALMLMSALHTPAMLEDCMGCHPISDDREQNLKAIVDLLIAGLRPEATPTQDVSAAPECDQLTV